MFFGLNSCFVSFYLGHVVYQFLGTGVIDFEAFDCSNAVVGRSFFSPSFVVGDLEMDFNIGKDSIKVFVLFRWASPLILVEIFFNSPLPLPIFYEIYSTGWGYYGLNRTSECCFADMSARAFYEPILVTDFVAKYFNVKDLTRPLSDQDCLKVFFGSYTSWHTVGFYINLLKSEY